MNSDEARAMRWTPPRRPPLDLVDIERRFLIPCGSCDAGLGMSCSCSDEDPRNVISNLVLAVENYRRLTKTIADMLREDPTYGANVDQILRDFTELDATRD